MTNTYIYEGANGLREIPIPSKLMTDRRLFLDEEITSATALDLAKAMMYLSETDDPVHLYINSPGGEVNAGLAIYDMIRGFSGPLYTYCIGRASSMAAVILASGRRRYILPHSQVMIHEPLISGGLGGSASSISKISDSILETRALVNGILARHTGKTVEEINSATAFDNLMNAQEAVAFGLCDEIIDSIF